MSTTRAMDPSRPRGGHHTRPAAYGGAHHAASRRLGRPQRVAVALVGLATGFLLGAGATALGGGQPGGLTAVAAVCLALAVPALIASRRQVVATVSTRAPVTAPAAAPTWAPPQAERVAVTPLRVVHNPYDVPARSLPRAA